MSTLREEKKKKKKKQIDTTTSISWQEKKEVADKEGNALEKEIQDLQNWTDMVDTMNDEELKDYLKNRPEELKALKTQKSKPRQRVKQARKTKSTASTGIMASVWKFHREDDEDCSIRLDP